MCFVFCVLMQSSCSVIRLVTLHISQKIVLTCSYSFIKRKKKTWKFIFNFGKVWQKKSQPNVRFKAFFRQCERWWRPWEVDESVSRLIKNVWGQYWYLRGSKLLILQTYLQQMLSFYDFVDFHYSEHLKNLLLAPWSPQQLTKSHRVFTSISATS